MKHELMMAFWSERVRAYASDPRANTNDIWLREVEIRAVEEVLAERPPARVLDFGCANGFSTLRLARQHPDITFVGIDLNPGMIAAAEVQRAQAEITNVSFRVFNVLERPLEEPFDLVYAIRVFQNLESLEAQQTAFDRLAESLTPAGRLFWIESYMDGYAELNAHREAMDLVALPIHPHLTLLSEAFERHAMGRLRFLRRAYPSSAYYWATRILYAFLAKQRGEEIDYNHPLHQAAALAPSMGAFGPQRALLFQAE